MAKFLKNLADTFQKYRPKPFKTLQRYLEIENEWKQLKKNIYRNKFKILFTLGIVGYPLYKPYMREMQTRCMNRIVTFVNN